MLHGKKHIICASIRKHKSVFSKPKNTISFKMSAFTGLRSINKRKIHTNLFARIIPTETMKLKVIATNGPQKRCC